jgi:hypothetical protein
LRRVEGRNGLNEKPTMRRFQRLIAASVLMALSGAVAGCSGSVSSWDPMDMLDFLDTKKKLPGERKPVFPDGVPGLEQGVPKSLYKGAQQEADQQNAQAAAAAAQAAEDTKPKRSAKSKSKQPATANADPAATPEEDTSAAAPPAPKPKKVVRQRTTAPPPDQPADAQPAAQPAQPAQPTQQSAAPFPAPLPGGTFQR